MEFFKFNEMLEVNNIQVNVLRNYPVYLRSSELEKWKNDILDKIKTL